MMAQLIMEVGGPIWFVAIHRDVIRAEIKIVRGRVGRIFTLFISM